MREEKNCYCTECKIPMKLMENDWLVQTKTANRVMTGDLYECEGCGKKVVTTNETFDQHYDKDIWRHLLSKSLQDFHGKRVLTLPDENYMSW